MGFIMYLVLSRLCGGNETVSTLFEPYRFCTPFTIFEIIKFQKLSSRSSNLTRKVCRYFARFRIKKYPIKGQFFNMRCTRVWYPWVQPL